MPSLVAMETAAVAWPIAVQFRVSYSGTCCITPVLYICKVTIKMYIASFSNRVLFFVLTYQIRSILWLVSCAELQKIKLSRNLRDLWVTTCVSPPGWSSREQLLESVCGRRVNLHLLQPIWRTRSEEDNGVIDDEMLEVNLSHQPKKKRADEDWFTEDFPSSSRPLRYAFIFWCKRKETRRLELKMRQTTSKVTSKRVFVYLSPSRWNRLWHLA